MPKSIRVPSRVIQPPTNELTEDQEKEILQYNHQKPTLSEKSLAEHFSREFQVCFFYLAFFGEKN